MDSGLANRMEGLFYSKSDEKFTLRSLLDELFGNRTFGRSLDIGCGPGHITEPLALRSRQLVLVEQLPKFQEILRKQFPTAKIISSDFREADLTGKFDVILFSHVLYYQRTEEWLDTCKSLMELLSDNGELIVILNADSGDWWKIVHGFEASLAQHMSFHYKPLSRFKRELSEIAQVQSFPYRFQVWIDPGATWSDFIGKQILEIFDEDVLRAHDAQFAEFAKQFKQIDGSFVLDFRGEMLRLRRRA